MSTPEANEDVIYIPADERRRAGAQDVYQTAARLRPLIRDIFKTGGLLDQFNLGNEAIEDHDSLNSSQFVRGVEIEQMFASRTDSAVHVTAEMGYLRHYPNLAPTVDSRLAVLIGTAREIALASSIYLDLPRMPAVTFDPVCIPKPENALYVGVLESFNQRPGMIQPLKTSKEYDDVTQPLLLWKADPYPSYWSDHNDSPASRQPLYQGDILISPCDDTKPVNSTAQTFIFAQSHSQEYRDQLRSLY